MRKINITKRDIKFFFIGVITVIILDSLINWKENKKDFLDGFNSVRSETIKQFLNYKAHLSIIVFIDTISESERNKKDNIVKRKYQRIKTNYNGAQQQQPLHNPIKSRFSSFQSIFEFD